MSRFDNTRPEVHADQARTLPARYYTDPALFEQELRRIHQEMWLHAGRAESLDAPGRYLLVRFAGVNVIVLRDEAARSRRSTTPAATAARFSAATRPDSWRAASSARTTRGPTASTAART